jgi:hypothetical protein
VERPLRYRRYDELDSVPNVIVDGAAGPSTVLTLSHWPGAPYLPGLSDDLSAQMAFAYLDAAERYAPAERHAPAEVVSNNHFDQDGLVSVFALCHPDKALPRRELLIDLAAAGDFATYRSRVAARLSMTVAAYADPGRSPLELNDGDYPALCDQLYTELLGRLPELCDRPELSRDLWAEEDADLTTSEAAIERGEVSIEEVPGLDLAVVTVPHGATVRGGHRFTSRWAAGLHPMAVHNATDRFAVLKMIGHSYEFAYRYESWVQYRSRAVRARVDLAPLAEELTAEEPGTARWVFDGPSDLIPRLHLEGAEESALGAGEFRRRLERALAVSPPAWDPASPTA